MITFRKIIYVHNDIRYFIKRNLETFFRQNNLRDFHLCEYLKKPRLDKQDGFINEVSVDCNLAHIERYLFLVMPSFAIFFFLNIPSYTILLYTNELLSIFFSDSSSNRHTENICGQ